MPRRNPKEAEIRSEQIHRSISPIPMAYRCVPSTRQHLIVFHVATGVPDGDFVQLDPGGWGLFWDRPGLSVALFSNVNAGHRTYVKVVPTKVVKFAANEAYVPKNASEFFLDDVVATWNTMLPGMSL
jgi:hypothetical protein